MTKRAMVRQGALLFVPLDGLTLTAKALEPEQLELSEGRGIVLAHSEATGHSHVLEAPEAPLYALSEPPDERRTTLEAVALTCRDSFTSEQLDSWVSAQHDPFGRNGRGGLG